MPSADVGLETKSRIIKEKLKDGTYSLIMHGLKTCKGNHWNTIRCVVDEEGVKIKNTYACSVTNCSAVFISNLSIEGTGKLSRHHKKCNRDKYNDINSIDSYFDKESTMQSAKRIKRDHISEINDAAVSFVVNDLRPWKLHQARFSQTVSCFHTNGRFVWKNEPGRCAENVAFSIFGGFLNIGFVYSYSYNIFLFYNHFQCLDCTAYHQHSVYCSRKVGR